MSAAVAEKGASRQGVEYASQGPRRLRFSEEVVVRIEDRSDGITQNYNHGSRGKDNMATGLSAVRLLLLLLPWLSKRVDRTTQRFRGHGAFRS